jgi:hypothetical protein
MEFTLSHGNQEETGRAMCYVSFGAVAFTAERLDRSKLVSLASRLPAARLLAEAAVGFIGLVSAKRFELTSQKHETLYDLLLINGPRIAKLYRTPAKLSSPDFVELRIRHKYPVLLTHVSKLTRVWARSTTVRRRSFVLHQSTWMQYDGEYRQLEPETAVRVAPARQSVYLLATK